MKCSKSPFLLIIGWGEPDKTIMNETVVNNVGLKTVSVCCQVTD